MQIMPAWFNALRATRRRKVFSTWAPGPWPSNRYSRLSRRLACAAAFCLLFVVVPLHAQYIAISGGALFPKDREFEGQPVNLGRSSMIAIDGGTSIFPFITAGVHYSRSEPGGRFAGSDVELTSHTVTLDLRLRSPMISGWRVYGLAGGGISRFKPDAIAPFSSVDSVTEPVFTFGGGIERQIVPYVKLKLEVRDYVTSTPERFFSTSGGWHRAAVLGGILIGR